MECVLVERLTEPQTWYVVFDKSHGGLGWWKRFIHKEFQHVLMYRDLGDQVLQYNTLSHMTGLLAHKLSLDDLIAYEIGRGVTAILSITVYYGALYKRCYLEPHTCVSAAKRLLGIRSRLITPKALYHELTKAGAHIIKPYVVT